MKRLILIILSISLCICPSYAGDINVKQVRGTSLEKLDDAYDILLKISSLAAVDGSFEIAGKGRAVIFVNGRRLERHSDLAMVPAKAVETVEIVSEPRPEYGNLDGVILITLVKAEEEEFNLSEVAEMTVSGFAGGSNNLEVSGMKGRFLYEGGLVAAYGGSSDSESRTTDGYALKPDKSGIWQDNRKVEDFTNVSRELSVAAKAGVGLLVTPQHLIGLRYEYNYLKSDGEWKDLQDAVFSRKGTAIDLVTPSSRFRASSVSKSDRHDHKLSLSYLGETDGWEFSANIDYTSGIQTGRDTDTESPEGKEELTSDSQSEFIAVDGFSRFNASHPLWKGDILFGLSLDNYVQNTNSEDNCTKDSRIHNNVLCLIPGAYVSLKQDFGPVKVDLGLQYRYYCSIYTPFDDDSTRGRITELMGQPRLSCLDWMLHPHLSVSVPVGKGAVSAGAQVLTDYPPFSSLSIMIDELKKNDASKAFAYPARRDEIYLKGEWERFQVKGWATRNQMPLFTDVDGGGDFNGPSYWSMDWKMTFSNAVGFWGTDITATLHKQWLDMETLKSDDNLSAPLVTVNWINSFSLPWGMKIDLSSLLRTGGAERNVYCRGVFFKADLSLRQSFLKDRLTLSLGADNLIRTTQDLSFHTKASDMEFVSSKRLEGRIFRLSVKFTL